LIGRVVAFVNQTAVAHWNDRVGHFGHYECIDEPEASAALLDAACDWLESQKVRAVWGPWNFVSQDFGFIVEGFDLQPVILSSYNPPYYNDQVANSGFKKKKDLLVYSCDLRTGYTLPDRITGFVAKIADRYNVTVRPINMRNIQADALSIVDLTNLALTDNWGYYPVDPSETNDLVKDLKQIANPETILFAEIDGKPIGYLLALPDINDLLKEMNGRLLPFGIFKLLTGLKKLIRYRIWAMGIDPKYQRKGISILLFDHLYKTLVDKKVYVEANYVLEDNHLMNNALRQLNFDLVKKYRVYEKVLH
jgi:GNAT superfamily N-acetyltransferase